jgi:hypothetical protein
MVLVRHYKGLTIFLVMILVLSGLVFYLPKYLLHSTGYQKADAIIILLGPDFKARRKEADQLIHQGMADYLIIPAYRKCYAIEDSGNEQYRLSAVHFPENKDNTPYPGFYEDTHIELIEAKKTMSFYGLKSAIFVSSPYHMRRIRLITAKLFNFDKDALYFVPTRYENAPASVFELSSSDWRKVRREYMKMIWFWVYSALSDF